MADIEDRDLSYGHSKEYLGFWLLNAQSRICYISSAMTDMLGYSPQDLLGSCLSKLVNQSTFQIFQTYLLEESKPLHNRECFLHHKNGSKLKSTLSITPILHEESSLNIFVCLIGAPKQSSYKDYVFLNKSTADNHFEAELACSPNIQEVLAKSENKWRSLIQNSSDMITLLAQDGKVQYESPSIKKIVGFSPEELVGKNIFDYIHPHDTPSVMSAFRSVIQEPGYSTTVEFRFQHKNGDWCYLEATGQSLVDEPSVASVVINSRDITERRLAEEKLHYHAMYDSLTHLPNRHHLLKKLGQILDYARQDRNYRFAVLFLDVDRFKIINDSLGHSTGDRLLVAMSRRLETCVRDRDIIARLGGDEFIIVLTDLQTEEVAIQTAERVAKSLSQPYQFHETEMYSSVSIGIVLSTTNYRDSEDLLRNADIALYRAKAIGRGCHVVFDTAMHDRVLDALQLENDLRQAIKNQEFFLVYQPIFELKTNRLEGFEALIRWNCPKRGLVLPSQFILIAEETGLIVPIGDWILTEACRQLRHWKKLDPSYGSLKISVNCSAKQFFQPDFVEKISQSLFKNQLSVSDLKIEITESVLLENTEQVTSIFSSLETLGVHLCMDDFGTGYSSLSYLHRFPIKSLKIDRSFIKNMLLGKKHSEIIKAILTMSVELGIDVVAEGIDTQNLLTHLTSLNCKYGQGYQLGKPMLPEDAFNLICDRCHQEHPYFATGS
ncbi:EAL domain-containing protein [Altericista sp. CCNU0014]|uniref:sensor domain-containing protein n=1 Tax=Altericista sp. CCNU0014 TaxID=3082949 RepID=UPI00384ADF73